MFGLVSVILRVLDVYAIIVIAAALITWVRPNPYNPVVKFLRRVTEPVLEPIRSLVPPEKLGGLDISPMIQLANVHQMFATVVSPYVDSRINQEGGRMAGPDIALRHGREAARSRAGRGSVY